MIIEYSSIVIFITILSAVSLPSVARNRYIQPEFSNNGYHLQEHLIITDDGYVLQVDRAVPKKRAKNSPNKSIEAAPVIVFHGIFTDSSIFFLGKSTDIKKCSKNLGSCLLNDDSRQHDVWFANARGNGRSTLHVNFTTMDEEYWKFSLEEIALYDLRAIIDYVLHETDAKSVGFIGYSQGASAMFALLSTIPTYRDKIRPFIAWAPTVYTHSSQTILKRVLQPFKSILLSESGQFPLSQTLLNWISGAYMPTGSMIELTKRLVFGPSYQEDNWKLYEYLSRQPASISNWQMAHFLQLWNSPDRQFRGLDFLSPLKRGRTFNLKKIAADYVPIIVMYGSNDWFVSPNDIEQLIEELRNNGLLIISEKLSNFNHVDFIFNLDDLINHKTRSFLNKYLP